MVTTSSPLGTNSRFCRVDSDLVNKRNIRHYHHPAHPVERPEFGDGSQGTDVDARINALLRRKVQLPSFHGEHVHSHTRPTSRSAYVPSSFRCAEDSYDVNPGFAGIDLLVEDGNARCRRSHLRGINEQVVPADVQAKMGNIATNASGTRPYIRENSPTTPKTFRGKAHAVSTPFSLSRVPGLAYAVAPDSSFPVAFASSAPSRQNSSANSFAKAVHTNHETIHDKREGRDAPSASDASRNTLDVNTRIDNVMKRTTDISQMLHDASSYGINSAGRKFVPNVALQPKLDDLGLEPFDVYDRHVSLDFVPGGLANIHSPPSICSLVGQPSPTFSSHADPDACWPKGSRVLPAGLHEPAMRNARSSSQTIGIDRSIERSCYNQVYHGPEQVGNQTRDGHRATNQDGLVVELYDRVPTPSYVGFFRQATASESLARGLSPQAIREKLIGSVEESQSPINPDGQPPHEDNSDRRIKNERAASILPSLEQVLDYVDEIASPVLPGMDILSFQRRREHLSVDDPLRSEIDQDECIQDVVCAGNDQSLSALPRLDPVVSPRNPRQSEDRLYLPKSGIPSPLEHRILQNANRERVYEEDVVRELRHSERALLFLGGHSSQGAHPPPGVHREGSSRRKDSGKSQSPIPSLEDINVDRESGRPNDVRKSTSQLPHLEEVIEDKESSWPDSIGKAAPPTPHLKDVIEDKESSRKASIGNATPMIPHLEQVIEDKESRRRDSVGKTSPPIPHLEDASMDQGLKSLIKDDGNFLSPSRQLKLDSFDDAKSRLFCGNIERSTGVSPLNGKDPVEFQTPRNFANEAKLLGSSRVKAVDPDAPLNRNRCAEGFGSDDDGSCRFPEQYDRYVANEDNAASARVPAAEKFTCDARDGAFATDFTMGETWPTQEDVQTQPDEESLDFSLGRLDDSRAGSKFLVAAPETIATPMNFESREVSAPWMRNYALREKLPAYVSKTQENPLSWLSQVAVDSPRLPNGIPAFVLAKVKHSSGNNRKAQVPRLHDSEVTTATKVGPELNDSELTITPSKNVPANGSSFVDQIMISIFGADPMGANALKRYFGERGHQWICCGESTTITIGNNLLDGTPNKGLPERAEVEAPFERRSSEHCPSVTRRSDAHLAPAHDVGIQCDVKPSQVATPNAPRTSDLNDVVVIVDGPSDEWDKGV